MSSKAPPLRLGTRRSRLALAQSGLVADAVSQVTGRPVELVEITTYGDTSREHLAQIGGTGVFVTALRDALLGGEVDFAVHSLKDLPTAQPDGLVLAAVPEREDPRDVIVARDALKFTDLPRGARIGTGSPRRTAQLNAYARSHGLDIETVPIRGNIDTRVGFVRDGELDAVVLAAAGLSRIGRIDEVTDFLSVDTVLPAPGQGALAIECAADHADLIAALGELDDPLTRIAVTAERSLLAALEAGCSAPPGRAGRPSGRRADCQGNAPARNSRHDRRFAYGAAVHHRSRARDAWPSAEARSRPRRRDARPGRGRSDGGASQVSPTTLPAAGPEHGHVTFLGAGPGDPGLLTLRAVEALANADVLVAEHEVLDVVLAHARPGVAVVHPDAGPSADSLPGTGTPQLTVVDGASTTVGLPAVRDAAHLVMEAARGGRRVVRAVSGDPGLDTYAAEEMLACVAAGVPFEVVPGVAAAVGVPAYAGVPLRDAQGADVRFVDARTASDRCWTEVGASDGTVVVSTSLDSVAAAAGELVAAGRKPDTPMTVTVAGTTTRQRTWSATLGTIAQTLKQAKVLPSPDGGRPVIAVVGERSAAAQRDQLSWFESKPLFGWKVLVPRTKEQAASLSDQLRSYGAVPHEVPTIAVEPPRTPQQMERAVKGLVTGRYEWIAFTSVNAVKAVREKFEEYGLDARAFAGIKVAAVGSRPPTR